jgi:hypothetical protein
MQNNCEHVNAKVTSNAADELGGWLTRQVRRGQTNGTALLKCVPVLVFCLAATGVFSQRAEHSTRAALLQKEEQALRHGLFPEVIRDLQPIQARNPEDVSVGLLLARAPISTAVKMKRRSLSCGRFLSEMPRTAWQ